MQGMKEFADKVANLTTLDDDAVIKLASLGASLGHLSGEGLQRATVAAIGFSRSLQVDMDSAMRLVAKAAEGNFTAFSRYGLKVDETASVSANFNRILTEGVKAFQLADEVNTTSGALEIMKRDFEDVEKKLGEHLAPIMKGWSQDLTRYTTEILPSFETQLSNIAQALFHVGENAKDAKDLLSGRLPIPSQALSSRP